MSDHRSSPAAEPRTLRGAPTIPAAGPRPSPPRGRVPGRPREERVLYPPRYDFTDPDSRRVRSIRVNVNLRQVPRMQDDGGHTEIAVSPPESTDRRGRWGPESPPGCNIAPRPRPPRPRARRTQRRQLSSPFQRVGRILPLNELDDPIEEAHEPLRAGIDDAHFPQHLEGFLGARDKDYSHDMHIIEPVIGISLPTAARRCASTAMSRATVMIVPSGDSPVRSRASSMLPTEPSPVPPTRGDPVRGRVRQR